MESNNRKQKSSSGIAGALIFGAATLLAGAIGGYILGKNQKAE